MIRDARSDSKQISAMDHSILLLVLLAGLSISLQLSAAEGDLNDMETPGIYIERSVDQSRAQIPGLQGLYQTCVDLHSVYQKLYEQGGIAWELTRSDLPKGYDVRAAPAPEPDWQKEAVGMHREEEYFLGDKYAKYAYNTAYEISQKDRCALIKHENLSIELDNGTERFLVSLEERRDPSALPGTGKTPLSMQYERHKVERMPSPTLSRRQNDAVLEEIGKDERIARLLSLLYADTESSRVPGVNVSFDPNAADNLKKLVGYSEDNVGRGELPLANDEHYVLGHGCDIIAAENFHGRLWYWAPMHYYPSIMERPILLKSEVTSSSKQLLMVEEATSFRVLPKIDNAVFSLEPGLQGTRKHSNSVPH